MGRLESRVLALLTLAILLAMPVLAWFSYQQVLPLTPPNPTLSPGVKEKVTPPQQESQPMPVKQPRSLPTKKHHPPRVP